MNKKIIHRIQNEAQYLIKTQNTIRDIAKLFKVSKSTVHKDMSERLLKISPDLAKEVRQILDKHIETRHIKGGASTKIKFLRT